MDELRIKSVNDNYKDLEVLKYMSEEQRALYFDQALRKIKLEQQLIETQIESEKKKRSWFRENSGILVMGGLSLAEMALACIISNNGMMPAWWKGLDMRIGKALRLR